MSDKQRLLDMLPSRVEDLEFKMRQLEGLTEGHEDLFKRFIYQQATEAVVAETGKIIPLASESNVNTLTEDVKLTEDSSVLQFIDPNGGMRTIRLPSPAISNRWYIINNTATP